ncbi:unnamed protein product [Staurois parvus]|uniref:Uncharacterized protein n=1 Tax=Staurois parvus TaxID=386267 RepID=A0ABN9BEV0_9NEOB|nr:unnamed protein product [Staurois parvus]
MSNSFLRKLQFQKIFKFAAVPAPVRPDSRRDRNTEAAYRHRPEEMAGRGRGRVAGAKDKVSTAGIPEQRRMVSVARGYRFCYTREYRQGG